MSKEQNANVKADANASCTVVPCTNAPCDEGTEKKEQSDLCKKNVGQEPSANGSESKESANKQSVNAEDINRLLLAGAENNVKPFFLSGIFRFILSAIKNVFLVLTFMFRLDSIAKASFLLFIGMALTGFIIFASYFLLEKTVKSPGVVLAVIENQFISHLEGGVIEKVYVAQGEKVEAGQDLMKLENIDISRERDNYLIKEQYLKAVIMRLKAELYPEFVPEFKSFRYNNNDLIQQYRIFLQNEKTLENKIKILETQKERIQIEISSAKIHLQNLHEEYDIARQQVELLSPLVTQGVGSTQLLLQRKADMARNKTATSETTEKIKSLEISLREAKEKIIEERASSLQKAQEEIATHINELHSVTSSLSSLTYLINRNILRSPVSGTVLRILNTTIGGVVRAGDALIEIVPDEGSIRVEAKVQPQDRAYIYLGQKAKVRPSMYSFSLDTMLITKIKSISPQTFFDDVTRTYYYKVFLEADIDTVKDTKEIVKNFLPGMTVEVNIISGEESLMQYFLTPIMRGLNNSLTERSTK